jgi:cyclohexanone monooxygenase
MTNARQIPETGSSGGNEFDAVIIGAGFAGMYAIHRLRKLGFRVVAIEAGSDVGGTWFWNRYPGARCDSESVEYSYSFSEELQQEWNWSERYATQPEILRYINHVADRFDLRRDIRFETRVTSAAWDEAANRWDIHTDKGDVVTAQFCIAAVGCLSMPRVPDYKGIHDFKGIHYHTGAWPQEGVDFKGKRVAVMGTGSTGIQAIPVIAKQAAHLVVLQRTPNFSLPARNAPLDPAVVREVKANYPEIRKRARLYPSGNAYIGDWMGTQSALEVTSAEREAEYERRWQLGGAKMLVAYRDIATNEEANKTAADFVRNKIRQIVKNPQVAESLCPYDYPIGAKRICLDSGYFETYNRDNVTLVDLRKTPITEFTPSGVRTSAAEYALDCIVFATGFDAITGTLLNIDFRGWKGLPLKQKWEAGPRAYLGVATAGFPNLFLVTGPGSPSVLSTVTTSIEQHIEWITDCMAHMRERGLTLIEPQSPAEDAWVAHVNEVANATLHVKANSWYLGANIPGKPRVFMPYIGGVGTYRKKCEEIVAKGYQGFSFAGNGQATMAGVT